MRDKCDIGQMLLSGKGITNSAFSVLKVQILSDACLYFTASCGTLHGKGYYWERGGRPMRTRQEVTMIVAELCSRIALLFPQEKIEAILFGSYARGDVDPGSDIDVLLLVDASRQDISDRNWQVGDLAAELLLDHGIVVSPIVENREYFNRNLQLFPFYRSIEREGVRISA